MKPRTVCSTAAGLLVAIHIHAQPMEAHHAGAVGTASSGVDTAWVRHMQSDRVIGVNDEGYAIAGDAEGNIYVTGLSTGSGTGWDFATIKYNHSGHMQWVARYNGAYGKRDIAYDVAVDGHGYVYVTGISEGGGPGDASFATIKYDPSGIMQWAAMYDGPELFASASCLTVDSRGNVYVTGKSDSQDPAGRPQKELVTVKYGPSGAELWVARYVSPIYGDSAPHAIAVDSSGSVYVTGTTHGTGTSADFTTIKYDAYGAEQWVSRYDGGQDLDWAHALALDKAGNVIVGGQSVGGNGLDYVLVKYNPEGIEQWVARYDGTANGHDYFNALAVDDGGNIYATGEVTARDGHRYCATIKYDGAGAEQWLKFHREPESIRAGGHGLVLDKTGHVYVMGSCDNGYVTVAYDSSGTELWVSRFVGSVIFFTSPIDIVLSASGDVCVTGYTATDTEGWVNDYATVCYTSSGAERWVARYDGAGSGDGASSVALDFSECLVVAGYHQGVDASSDYCAVKYTASGATQWTRMFGAWGACDHPTAVVTTPGGDVLVTGWSDRSLSGCNYATVKFDAAGVFRWVARYNGDGNREDVPASVAVDTAGNVYVTGRSHGLETCSDFATIKYDSSGVEQWVARINGPVNGDDAACALALDRHGNVYVTGWSEGSGTARDFMTVKYSPEGGRLWTARYNGPANGKDEAAALAVDSSGTVYVTGRSDGVGTAADYVTIHYNASGVEQWVARYNGGDSRDDAALAIVLDRRRNVCVTGWSEGSGTDRDYATVVYNQAGEVQWVSRYNAPSNSRDEAVALATDSAHCVYVTGASRGLDGNRDFVTIKYDSLGTMSWLACYAGDPEADDRPCGLCVDRSGGVYVAGTSSSGSMSQMTVVKYIQNAVTDNDVAETPPSRFSLSQNYPNPFNSSTTIRYEVPGPSMVRLSVYDLLGRELSVLVTQTKNQGIHEVRFNAGGFPSGVYFYRLRAGLMHQTRRLLLLK